MSTVIAVTSPWFFTIVLQRRENGVAHLVVVRLGDGTSMPSLASATGLANLAARARIAVVGFFDD